MRYRTYICASLIVAAFAAGILLVPSGTAKTIAADRATLLVVPFLTKIAAIEAAANSSSFEAGSFTDRSSGGNEAVCSGSERVWDGEGTTNNWSEAANWCNDQVPPSGTGVRFNSTSTKDVNIDVSPSTGAFIIESGYTGTISIAGTNTVTAGTNGASFEQAGGTFNAGSGSFTQQFGSVSMNGGSFNGGSGLLNIPSMGMNGGTFDAGASTHNATNIIMSGGHIVFTSGTMTIIGSFFRSGGTGDFDNGTIVAAGGGNQSLEGIYGTVNNLTINKSDSVGVNTIGTIAVLGTLTLTDGIYSGTGTLEARGSVSIASTFGNDSQGGGGGMIALRNGSGPRTVTLPAGVRMTELIVDDANVQVNTNGAGTINLDDLTINSGSVDLGSTNLIFGYTTSVQGSHYVQNGGSFNIDTGNITWNTGGNFTLNSGTFIAGSGTVQLGGVQFILTGGTFTPSTGDNTFCSSLSTAFTQSGGIFAAGAGSVDVNGSFNLSGGTFNAPLGNMFVGFAFDQTAGTFNHNNGTLIFDSSHPSYTINLPGNPGTGQFNNLVFAPTTDNAQISLNFDTWSAGGNITIVNGRVADGVLRAERNFTVEPGADGGTAEVRFAGTANQTYQNNGGVDPTGTVTVDKAAGIVTAASDMLLGATQALNIVAGTLFLANGSDLRSGDLTVGANGRLVNHSSATITLGGNVSNSGRIDLQGGGADCPGSDLILIRSTVSGTRRQWNGAGAFRIVDADIQDMAGTAAITAYSSTNSGNVGANWTFNGGCPAALSISPETVSLYRNQTQNFAAGGGFAPRTFSIIQNNSGASINASSGLYTAGNTMNVADTVRVTDAFGSTAEATVNVIPGPPTRLVFTVQPSNATAGQSISPSIQVAVQDNDGNTIPNATNAVTLNLLNNPGGSTLSGTITRNAVNGIATFDDVSLNKAANGYTLQASASGLTGAVSTAFNISPGAPAQLAFDQQPSNVYPGATITPSVRVVVLDAFGNPATGTTVPITLTIGSNPGGGTLFNGGPTNSINGTVTFTCRIEGNLNFGSGYTLVASSPGLPDATSQPFDVLSPFVVVNTNSSGQGSFRGAILTANQTPGHQTITFNIPGAPPHKINYLGPTPAQTITDPVMIDGTTQPGYSGIPVIEINGSQSTAGNPGALRAESPNNTIKGLAFTGFGSTALQIASASNNNIITGNYFGLTPLGVPAGNHTGISVGSSGNLIGGSDPMDKNVIAGNNVGISFFSGGQNTVKGNLIGTAPDGIAPMPNLVGLLVTSGQNIIIGGTSIGDGNKIAFNTQDGIRINAASVRVNGNSIHSNNGPGIELQPLGVNGNDNCDADTGPNGKQNFPVISSVNLVGGGAQIEASLNSTPNQTFTIDYYANPVADPSGYGEGRTWIGSQTVTTGSNCSTGTFGFTATSVPADTTNITATATDSQGRTSEFSEAKGALISISGTVRTSTNQPVSGVSVELRNSISTPIIRNALTDSAGRFTIFGLNPGDNYFVSMTKANHTFSPPTRTYTALNSPADDNYTANVNYLTISGKVSTNGVGVSGVTVTLSGAASRTATTDSAGNYAFTNLLAGIYTVTPSRTGFTFTPSSSTQGVSTNVAINFTTQNPLTQLPGYFVYVRNGNLEKMKPDGSGVATLASGSNQSNFDGSAVSRDGTKIAFSQRDVGISTMNFDGSGKQLRLVDAGPDDGMYEIDWSPDKSKLVFSRYVSASNPSYSAFKIVTLNVSNGTTADLTGNNEVFESPRFSTDGTSDIVAKKWDIAQWRGLYTMTSAGSGRTLVVNGNAYSPGWFHIPLLGSRIAFVEEGDILSVHPDGSNRQILTSDNGWISSLDFSPGEDWLSYNSDTVQNVSLIRRLMVFKRADPATKYEVGQGMLFPRWGATPTSTPSGGTNPSVAAGNFRIQFTGIPFSPEGAAEVTHEPIMPESLGGAPSGYGFTQTGYELSITGTFTPPATVCITIPAERYGTSAQFQRLRLLHFTGGSFVDVTSLPNNETERTVCGDVSELGGFVVAELTDPAMPSIIGQVVDENGQPIVDHVVTLTGDEERMTRTDQEGIFAFTTLRPGGYYNVAPNLHGYLFDISPAVFDEISGENTIVFRGRAAEFTVSGSVRTGGGLPVPGVEIRLSGSVEQATTTDANGEYSVTGIPANSSFEIVARPDVPGQAPRPLSVAGISMDMGGMDFILLGPTAASVSIGGRVFAPDGRALRNATVTVTAADGTVRRAVTGNFGYFRVEGLEAGSNYAVTVSSRRYVFDSVTVYADSDRDDLVFNGRPR